MAYTSKSPASCSKHRLWIAFILVSNLWHIHRISLDPRRAAGCELLSFMYLTYGIYISRPRTLTASSVVNCFHSCISLMAYTSRTCTSSTRERLWIAFILVSHLWHIHLSRFEFRRFRCCELLSFLYLTYGIYIPVPVCERPYRVVNCFHSCI